MSWAFVALAVYQGLIAVWIAYMALVGIRVQYGYRGKQWA